MVEQIGFSGLSWAMASQSESRQTTFASCSGNPASNGSCVNSHRHLGVFQHEGQSLFRIRRIQGHIYSARL